MVTGERLTITLKGGAPWGFRLQGGDSFPLEVAKIRKNSHSHTAGLKEGDIVLSINSHSMTGKSHQSAMDIVDIAGNQLVFVVTRSGSDTGASRPLDPQRHPRIIPMVSGHENARPGILSTAQAKFSTTDGNTRTDVNTDEYVMKTGDGRKITKTVTEQRITRYPPGSGLSQTQNHSSLTSNGFTSRSSLNKSPQVWKPSSQASIHRSQSDLDLSSSQWKTSPVTYQSSKKFSQTSTSPNKYSTLPRSGSSANNQSKLKVAANKGNIDPIILSEQAKWEKKYGSENVLKAKINNGESKMNQPYVRPRMDDPNYPMFELPRPDWLPSKNAAQTPEPFSSESKKIAPAVAPKPLSAAPSPISFNLNEQTSSGIDKHHLGQPKTLPAPPSPPLPSNLLNPRKSNVALMSKKFDSLEASTPKGYVPDSKDSLDNQPNHLHVFAPNVVIAPEDDSGMLSPERAYSDISSQSKYKKKLFSDSAFYDDSTNRFPTIDEQMSMCKKIAQSLTSVANKRARGARMFAKRRRKSDRWIHDQIGSEYSSSTGDVADLGDLDSELFYEEGGNKPLFTFRIPKVAGQVSLGQKMSLSKDEFELLRLAAPKVNHHGVSPNMCFSIAADLHKGGKNKGAKLFQKRQARVEKFVIDETNVLKSPVSPSTKLEYIVQHQEQPHKSPWNAAAIQDVSKASEIKDQTTATTWSIPSMPKYKLPTDHQPKVLKGQNFNKLAKGWGSSELDQHQPNYYRESDDPSGDTSHKNWHQKQFAVENIDPNDKIKQINKHSNYNQRVKAWNRTVEKPETEPVDLVEQTRNRQKPKVSVIKNPMVEYGDYNSRLKAWLGPMDIASVNKTSQTHKNSYNSLPRGFAKLPLDNSHLTGCDL